MYFTTQLVFKRSKLLDRYYNLYTAYIIDDGTVNILCGMFIKFYEINKQIIDRFSHGNNYSGPTGSKNG